MATTVNQKVYVSPGVYTSETDLSFVAQSVGVTTLGLVGETLKGPAFEPVFITNYEEFEAYFGGTQPTKFINTQIPKYEAAYIAKSYLQQSNQLFVTRILGLSGYDAGPSWSIRVLANVNPLSIDEFASSSTFDVTISGNTTGGTLNFVVPFPEIINQNINKVYTAPDGNTSTMFNDIQNQLNNFVTGVENSATTAIVYGAISSPDFESLTADTASNRPNIINPYGVDSCSWNFNDKDSSKNDPWYYANFNFIDDSFDGYTGYSYFYFVETLTVDSNSNFIANIRTRYYSYEGYPYSQYNNMVVATLRSRAISLYDTNNHGPIYEVPNIENVILDTENQYSASLTNPLELFLISGFTKDNDEFLFETSLAPSSSTYISSTNKGTSCRFLPKLSDPKILEI